MVMAPSSSINGEVAACARTHRRLVFRSRRVAALNLATSNNYMTNANTIGNPVNVSLNTRLSAAILKAYTMKIVEVGPISEQEHMSEHQSPKHSIFRP